MDICGHTQNALQQHKYSMTKAGSRESRVKYIQYEIAFKLNLPYPNFVSLVTQ